ncbi:MAG TPA: maleylpyruvate isomerase family mycothiol-dependent enzyme [Microlunatus sp.]
MSTTSTTGVTRIDREEARALASAEFEKFAALAASLTQQEWATDTDCVGWDVRTMVLHVLGSADAQASPSVFLHQLRRGLPLNKEIDSHHWVDGLNELQIRERSKLTNSEVVAQLGAVGTKAVNGRFGTPLPMRYVPVPFGEPIGWKPVNYLLEVGFTRDVWAHRIDIHAAIGRPMELDAAHDGRLVADIVGEWAALHREPFELHLTGTAGGTFSQGDDGEHVEMDALDFVRTLAGRLTADGVMRHPLPL